MLGYDSSLSPPAVAVVLDDDEPARCNLIACRTFPPRGSKVQLPVSLGSHMFPAYSHMVVFVSGCMSDARLDAFPAYYDAVREGSRPFVRPHVRVVVTWPDVPSISAACGISSWYLLLSLTK